MKSSGLEMNLVTCLHTKFNAPLKTQIMTKKPQNDRVEFGKNTGFKLNIITGQRSSEWGTVASVKTIEHGSYSQNLILKNATSWTHPECYKLSNFLLGDGSSRTKSQLLLFRSWSTTAVLLLLGRCCGASFSLKMLPQIWSKAQR